MNDFNKRVNSIVVKNLPIEFTASQLEQLFSPYGRILSSKVLGQNSSFEGGCGFVNYADGESSNQAVEHMNNYVVNGNILYVSHSKLRQANNNFNRPQNGFTNGEANSRPMFASTVTPEETPSPGGTNNRFSGFRSMAERSPSTTQSKPTSINSSHSSTNELNNNGGQQRAFNGKSPFQNGIPLVNQSPMRIDEHRPFVMNTTYNIYLSNLEVPNVVFATTLDDYVNATLLITQMNKHEKLAKVQGNSYNAKLSIGQICAALFNADWYRARVLELDESRVRVQYIDWGNTGWCDPVLEIRPLPNEYYKEPALCVKCILDGVSSNEKLSNEQTDAILGILVLDLKFEMTVLRIENEIPYVRLNLGERILNNEVRAILPSSTIAKQKPIINFDSNKPEINLSEIHYVQLTTVDPKSDCFYVLLMRDCLATIMNVLKDWNASKQPLTASPKPNMLVCAQYNADDFWYRAWIQNVTENGYRVYFVDFGNDEIVSIDRLSECPDILRTIPWLCTKVKLTNIKLTDDERYILLRDFETDRLEMKIIQKQQDIYHVDLVTNGKSLVEHILELRKKQPAQITPIAIEAPKLPIEPIQQIVTAVSAIENLIRTSNENSQPVPSIVDVPVQPTLLTSGKILQPPITTTDVAKTSLNSVLKPTPTTEPKNDDSVNDNLTTLITEQRRQNRLLEQVIAAINTTNALLTQLVQR
ncbi:unnamed protein product [Rotaria magnacalcarata]|uniref:Uncharacterized protein n=2 Tax=Rotaria magnacalcarata TaxID=392030 RepID=A0A816KL11_9BILA|nr:unnamed protein product [Rotaria magnacalcarata]